VRLSIKKGLTSFFRYESFGEAPQKPTPYFKRLHGGRKMYNALQKSVRESYGSFEWQGYAADMDMMPKWLFESFYGWHPDVKNGSCYRYSKDVMIARQANG